MRCSSDTYRYARLIESAAREGRLGGAPVMGTVVDVGCGAGPGGIVAIRAGLASKAVLGDVNDAALRLARVNAALAGVEGSLIVTKSDVLSAVTDPIDVVVSNPPYLKDPGARTYRDGGGAFGEALAVRIVRDALARLRRGGRIIIYTGVAIVDGEDVFLREIEPLCREAGAQWAYEEIDPDVFGEELETPAYGSADRIAAVGLHVRVGRT
jgi:methylase of polypeptide subunit release factors